MTEEPTGLPEETAPDRASVAFRAALDAHAADVRLAALDPEALRLLAAARALPLAPPTGGARRRDPHRRAGWRFALAAALAVVLAIPVVALVTRGRTQASMSTEQTPMAASAEQEGALSGATSATAGPARTTAARPARDTASAKLPQAASGSRWVLLGDAAVQVPDSWIEARPNGLWCQGVDGGRQPDGPYVALAAAFDDLPNAANACSDPPAGEQVEHLQWRPAGPGEEGEERRSNGWLYTSVVVGSTRLTYVHRAGTGDALLDTAVAVG